MKSHEKKRKYHKFIGMKELRSFVVCGETELFWGKKYFGWVCIF